MIKKPLVIYHANCADGFSAAWCFWNKYGDEFEYYPGVYSAPIPDVVDRDVYLVDFSYKRDVVEKKIIPFARRVVLLDHHTSALTDLAELIGLDQVHCTLNKSGARIAWEFVNGNEEPPIVLQHIEDRDLWLFKMKGSKEISEVVFSYEYTFDNWDRLMSIREEEIPAVIERGSAIQKKHMKDVHELLVACKRKFIINGMFVPTANMPYMMASDAGMIMSATSCFAATYYDTEEHRVFSLRSNPAYPQWGDVSIVAAKYGGGGHKHAAGFRVPRDHKLAKL